MSMRGRRTFGFTLIELMVTVVVLGVLMAVAAPNMRDFLDRQRLVGQVREIANLAQLARSEAISHSASGAAEVKSIAMTVSPGTSWFVGLSNGTAACSTSGTPACTINQGGSSVSHTVTGSECSTCRMVSPTTVQGTQLVVFDLRGLVSGTDRTITLQSQLGRQLSVSISRLGRISICTPNSLSGYPAC